MGKWANNAIVIAGAPDIPGLVLRGFRGEVDYSAMLAAINGSKVADGEERTLSVEDVARNYKYLVNCDPYQDMLFAEVQGEVVGYSRVWWDQELGGPRLYSHFCYLLPAWRAQGIRRAMLRYSERRALEIEAAQDGGAASDSSLQAWASDLEHDWTNLLLDEGYEAVRYGFEMVRPDLEDIPELPLPAGLQVRPVRPEHYRPIWDAEVEAFRDHWGATETHEQDFVAWQESPEFTPELWQVAWEGEQVAGMVRSFINHEENAEYGRLRGYTENISVRRPWRRRGLARALIARSLRLLKELGMSEAALGVDAQNPNGALRLYQSMGFREVKRGVTFRKLLCGRKTKR